MNQTRLGSFIEAMLNTLIGYFLNLGVQLVVYPFFGATFTFGQIRAMRPSVSIRKVLRMTPMNVRPYIDFSAQAP